MAGSAAARCSRAWRIRSASGALELGGLTPLQTLPTAPSQVASWGGGGRCRTSEADQRGGKSRREAEEKQEHGGRAVDGAFEAGKSRHDTHP